MSLISNFKFQISNIRMGFFHPLQNRRGAILLMVIGIVIFVLLLGLLIINIYSTDVQVARNSKNSLIAFYIAEAGIHYALPMLDYDSDWRTGVVMNFNGGSFTVSLSDEGDGIVMVKSIGIYKGAQRTIKVKIQMGNWPMFKYDAERTAYNTPQHYIARELQFRWYFNTGGPVRSSPAIDKSVVVFGCMDNRVYCVRAGNGTLVWSYPTGGDVVSSPCIVAKFNKVYVGSDDGYFYCFDLTTGALAWRYRNALNPRPWQASPCFYNDKIYTASNDGYVYCFNPEDGTIPAGWPYLIGTNVGIYSSPAIDTANDVLYIGADNGRVYALNIATVSLVSGWPYVTGGAVKSTAAIAWGYIYIASQDNYVYCLRPNGTRRWRNDIFRGGFWSSPSVAKDYNEILIGSHWKRYYGLSATTGNVIDWYNTSQDCDTTGAVQDDQVFIGNDSNYCVALNIPDFRGRTPFKYLTNADVNSSPAIYGNNLYVGNDGNRLYKFSSQVTPTGTITFMTDTWRDTY